MCDDCSDCFSEEEKKKLQKKGWSEEDIEFVESTVVEDRIKDLIK